MSARLPREPEEWSGEQVSRRSKRTFEFEEVRHKCFRRTTQNHKACRLIILELLQSCHNIIRTDRLG